MKKISDSPAPRAKRATLGTRKASKTVKLNTWDEVEAYFHQQLTPIRFRTNGQPVYRAKDIAALNIEYPDE